MARMPETGREKTARKRARKGKRRARKAVVEAADTVGIDEDRVREALLNDPQDQSEEHTPSKRVDTAQNRNLPAPFEGVPAYSTNAQPDREPTLIPHDKWHPGTSDHPANVDGRSVSVYLQCTAKAKSTGIRCKGRAVRGSDKCRMHGGTAKHDQGAGGLYSKYNHGRLGELVQEMRDDPDISSMREEVALLKALLDENIRAIAASKRPELKLQEHTDQVLKCVEGLRRATATMVDIEEKLHMTIGVGQLEMLISQVVTIIRQEVKDEEERRRIASRLASLDVPIHRRRA